MKKIIFISILFLSLTVHAQKITAVLTTNQEIVGKNQPIVLTVTLNQRAQKVQMPVLNDFKIVSEPGDVKTYSEMVGQEESSVETVTQSYTCCIIPKFPGKFVIPSFVCLIDGKEVKTNDLKIKVEERRISYNDSASVASKYSGIIVGSQGSNVETKSAIDYNKTDKTLLPKEKQIGTGVQKFEITPQKKTINAKVGDVFIVTYDIYKEAPRSEFEGNIELLPLENLTGIVLIDGPVRHFESSMNSTTRVQSGTAEIMIQTQTKGKFILPSLQAKYGEIIISSVVVEIIVE